MDLLAIAMMMTMVKNPSEFTRKREAKKESKFTENSMKESTKQNTLLIMLRLKTINSTSKGTKAIQLNFNTKMTTTPSVSVSTLRKRKRLLSVIETVQLLICSSHLQKSIIKVPTKDTSSKIKKAEASSTVILKNGDLIGKIPSIIIHLRFINQADNLSLLCHENCRYFV